MFEQTNKWMQKSNVGNFFGTKLRIRKKRNKQTELIIYTYSCTFLIIVDALIAFSPFFQLVLSSVPNCWQLSKHWSSQNCTLSLPPASRLLCPPKCHICDTFASSYTFRSVSKHTLRYTHYRPGTTQNSNQLEIISNGMITNQKSLQLCTKSTV